MKSHTTPMGSRSQARSLRGCISLCERTWPCLFPWDQLNDRLLFFFLNCYTKRRGRISGVFFFLLFLQKRDMAHFNITVICVSAHKSSIWKSPMVSQWWQALSNATLSVHSIPGALFHTWNGNTFTNCPGPSLHWPTHQILFWSFLSWIISCSSFYIHML